MKDSLLVTSLLHLNFGNVHHIVIPLVLLYLKTNTKKIDNVAFLRFSNAKLIGEILSELKFASDMDIRITNDRLTGFLKNLSTDVWFTLRLVSLEYHLLESVDMAQRKEFLKEVDELIKNTLDTQKNIKNTETY